MAGRQRNTWGINFQRSSNSAKSSAPTVAYNANPPPECLQQHTRSQYDTAFVNHVASIGGVSRTATSIGKKRVKDDDDYFNEEEPPINNLEYIPAPNSPAAQKPGDGNDSDGSEDALDAYMNEIDNELKQQKTTDNKQKQKGLREDLECEDEVESYIKFMEMNPHIGSYGDEDDVKYEYDEDGNIINKEKKAIEPLVPTDHSCVNYATFEKNFYTAHDDIVALNMSEVDELLKKLNINIKGMLPPKPVCSFAHFGFDEKLMSLIRKANYTQPTSIQAMAIPAALSGRDVIGIAKTGSGKTAAFLWPLLIHIMDQPELKLGDGPIGVICAPTRELALQIYQEAKKFGKVYNIEVVCAFGGGNMHEQEKGCETGCEILVCTPGRLIDLVKKKATNLRRVTYLVFDEADKMFNLGFESQVRSIAKNIRPDRQTLLFSATFKWKIEKLARDVLTDPIRIVQGLAGEANEDVSQIVQVLSKEDQKWPWILSNIVRLTTIGSVLIFVTRKVTSVEVADKLKLFNYDCLLINGDVHQIDRNSVIQNFKKGECRILVATDIAARGLDIPIIKTVINYDVAKDIDTHTHRIGRTGRAGMKGTAYTLVTREKDKDFAAHLVRNLEGASQEVSQDLLDLAMMNSWFKDSRKGVHKSGKQISKNLGMKVRPGLGSVHEHSSTSNRDVAAFDEGLGCGPQTDRITAMKAAFNNQYQRMFVSAGVEGSKFTHPERLGEHATSQGGSATSNNVVEDDKKSRKRKSRWD